MQSILRLNSILICILLIAYKLKEKRMSIERTKVGKRPIQVHKCVRSIYQLKATRAATQNALNKQSPAQHKLRSTFEMIIIFCAL